MQRDVRQDLWWYAGQPEFWLKFLALVGAFALVFGVGAWAVVQVGRFMRSHGQRRRKRQVSRRRARRNYGRIRIPKDSAIWHIKQHK